MKKMLIAMFLSPLVILLWGIFVIPIASTGVEEFSFYDVFYSYYSSFWVVGFLFYFAIYYFFMLMGAIVGTPYHAFLKYKGMCSWGWYVIPTLIFSSLISFCFSVIDSDEESILMALWSSVPIFLGIVISFVSMSLLYRAIAYGFPLRQTFKANLLLFVAYGVVLFLYGLIIGR